MSDDQSFRTGNPNDGKRAKIRVPLRRRGEQEEAPYAMDEGDRLLGGVIEYSEWDTYNNEARKVDRGLVTDWENTLNTLLVFVSPRP